MDVLESFGNLQSTNPNSDVCIVGGAAMVISRPPRGANTFDDYAKDGILTYIKSCTDKSLRVDICV